MEDDSETGKENADIADNDDAIIDRYNLNDYDDDGEGDDLTLNHSELVVFPDNNQDPYLNNEENFSDVNHKKLNECLLIFTIISLGRRRK